MKILNRFTGELILEVADLRFADLRSADLRFADLRSADLRSIRSDYFKVLSVVPDEVPALRLALVEGRVNGSSYTGDCARLVGAIANARDCQYDEITALKPDAGRPSERFFLAIQKGHTPENSQFSKIAVEWIDQWKEANLESPVEAQ